MARDFAFDPAHRPLRWILALGLAVRLVLAPLTAWGIDTTFFALSDLNFLYAGNPYRGNTFYNPPLGPTLQLPGVAGLTQLGHVTHLITYVPGLLDTATQTGMYTPYLPSPAFLLALKLPLIAADVLTAILLYRLLGTTVGRRFATLASAVWFLNPLVIWASAVHGEVDALSALAVVGFVYCWRRDSAFGAGAALGLGTLAKLYPVFFVPMAVVLFGRAATGRPDARRLGLLAAGFAAAVAPFAPLLVSAVGGVAGHQAGDNEFGGLSVLIILNPGLSSWAASLPPSLSSFAQVSYEVAFGVAIVATVAVVLRAPAAYRPGAPGSLARVASLLTALAAGALLAIVSPQAENLVDLLPPVLLMVPEIRARSAVALAGGLGAIGWAQYLSLLGPLAFFYPLAGWLGPSAMAAVNRSVIGYGTSTGLVSQATFWIVAGVLGGGLILALWGWTVARALRSALRGDRDLRRSAIEPVPEARSRGRLRRWDPDGASARGRPSRAATVVAALTVVATGALAVVGESRSSPALFQATVVAFESSPSGTSAEVHVQVGDYPMSARLGLIPASARSAGPVYFFLDPAYPAPYATYTEAYGVSERVSEALRALGASDTVRDVDAAQLSAVLAAPGPATLVVVGGLLPDTVLRGQASPLERWVAAGGTLIWAGGPLGYAEGHPLPDGGFYWDPLLWEGQIDLIGFPLTDPGTTGPISGDAPSAMAEALGLEFNGTPSGANVTQVEAYGGTVLGWTAPGGEPGEGPRASLVRLPVAAGRILFFGGAFFSATRPQHFVPLADFTLSADLTVLLATNVDPTGTGASSVDLSLPAGANAVIAVAGHFRGQALVLLSDPTSLVPFGEFAAFLPGPGTAGGVPSVALVPVGPSMAASSAKEEG